MILQTAPIHGEIHPMFGLFMVVGSDRIDEYDLEEISP